MSNPKIDSDEKIKLMIAGLNVFNSLSEDDFKKTLNITDQAKLTETVKNIVKDKAVVPELLKLETAEAINAEIPNFAPVVFLTKVVNNEATVDVSKKAETPFKEIIARIVKDFESNKDKAIATKSIEKYSTNVIEIVVCNIASLYVQPDPTPAPAPGPNPDANQTPASVPSPAGNQTPTDATKTQNTPTQNATSAPASDANSTSPATAAQTNSSETQASVAAQQPTTEQPQAPAAPQQQSTEQPQAPAAPQQTPTEQPQAPVVPQQTPTEQPQAPVVPQQQPIQQPQAPVVPQQQSTEQPQAPVVPLSTNNRLVQVYKFESKFIL